MSPEKYNFNFSHNMEPRARMTKTELGKIIYETSNIRGEFILRSGQTTKEYFDKYLFEANPKILCHISDHMMKLLPEKFDQLAGLEMGGIPVATALSLRSDIPVLFVRKKAKTYGTCKLAEGREVKNSELVIVEDVVTSGGAVLDAVRALRSRGATVQHVCCVIDREGTGRENLKGESLNFTPLFTKSELEECAQL